MSLGRFLDAMESGLPQRAIFTDDPLRVKMLVAHHVEYARLVSEQRGMLTYVGECNASMLAVISVGYGESSLLAWLGEAFACGVKEAVYIGECASADTDIGLMNVIAATCASGAKGDSLPDPGLLAKTGLAAKKMGIPIHILQVHTDDTFWLDEQPALNSGKKAIDFATNAFYWKSSNEGVKAISILTVSEHSLTGRRIDEAQRQSRFNNAAKLAFDALSN